MNRRQFVASSTALVAGGLAGCSGSSVGGDVFESVEANGFDLDVELDRDAEIRELTLTKDGEYITDTTLSAGEYATTMPLLDYRAPRGELEWMYPRGDLTLAGVDNDGEEYDHELTLMPDSAIGAVSVTADSESRPKVMVENTGSGPDAVLNIGVMSDAPVEPFDLRDDSAVVEGDPDGSTHVPLAVGESVEVLPSEGVFVFEALPEDSTRDPEPEQFNDRADLRDAWGDEIAEVEVRVEMSEQLLSAELDLRFSGELEQVGDSWTSPTYYFTEPELVEASTDISDR